MRCGPNPTSDIRATTSGCRSFEISNSDSLLNANDCSLPVPFLHHGHTEHFSLLSREGTSRLQGPSEIIVLIAWQELCTYETDGLISARLFLKEED